MRKVQAEPDDGLGRAWALTTDLVVAAHSLNPYAHVRAFKRLLKKGDMRGGLYVYYLTSAHVEARCGHRPSPEDIQGVALSVFPGISRLLRVDVPKVEDLLRGYWKLETVGGEVIGSDAILIGSAVLGVMLERPEAQLEEMRPALSEWFAEVRQIAGL
jgi:hypothetical protein